jgi:hypothetical protein
VTLDGWNAFAAGAAPAAEVVLTRHPPRPPAEPEPPRPAEVDAPPGSLRRGDPGHTTPHAPKHRRKARPRMSLPRIPYVKGPTMNGDNYPSHRTTYQTAEGDRVAYGLPVAEPEPVELTSMKRGLHPYQWVVYTVVLITCVAVLYSLVEGYLFIGRLQDALQEFGNGLQGVGG